MIFSPIDFITESNRIEGIHREPTAEEVEEHRWFMALEAITIPDLQKFVKIYQSNAVLRDKIGYDVRVGSYVPPKGGPEIIDRLVTTLMLANCNDGDAREAYYVHHRYEQLHPFTDGNGRSGRMLWMWMMKSAPLGFLHTWYYQSLSYGR